LDGLEVRDRPVERTPTARVAESLIERFLSNANRSGSDVDSSYLEPRQDLLQSSSLHPTQEILDGNWCIVEHNLARLRSFVAELRYVFGHGVSISVLVYEQDTHPSMGWLSRPVSLDEDGQWIGEPGIRDPEFGTSDDVVVALFAGFSRDSLQVGAGIGFS